MTNGPLIDFTVDGHAPGSRIEMRREGGTIDVGWKAESATIPMSKVELVMNGEVKESRSIKPWQDQGNWSVKIKKSSWLALFVRGHHPGQPEIITAHTSPVMIPVKGSDFMAAADAITILEQIEGSLVYLDTIGIRAEDVAYKRMRLVLESAHRSLHNRMHKNGVFHDHSPNAKHSD